MCRQDLQNYLDTQASRYLEFIIKNIWESQNSQHPALCK